MNTSSFLSVALGILIIPILVLPLDGSVFIFTKMVAAALLALILLALYVFRTLKRGAIELTWSAPVAGILALVIGYLISAFFSQHPGLSLWGYQLEPDTLGAIIIFSALALLTAVSVPRSRIMSVFLAFLAATWIVFIFQILQLSLGTPIAIAGVVDKTTNLVGSWTDFGIFVGLAASLALLALESLPLRRWEQGVVAVTLAVALFFMTLSNSSTVWGAVGVVAFIMLIHSLVARYFVSGEGVRRPGAVVLGIVVALSLSFFFMGGGIATVLQGAMHIQALEVHPSVQGTISVMKGVYAHNAVTGTGPNTFQAAWLLYRPSVVLSTPFWDTNFMTGSGSIPTAVAVGGLVVALGWLVFIVTLLWTTVRSLILIPIGEDRLYFVTALTALGTLYLGAVEIFAAPGPTVTTLFFIMIGLFLASLSGTRLSNAGAFTLQSFPRLGFAALLLIIVALIGGIVGAYGIGRSYASALFYGRAITAANQGDLTRAIAALQSATSLSKEDRYYRALAVVDLSRMQQVVSSGKSDTAAQQEFQQALTDAIQNSGTALAIDGMRFENWLTRANVYGSVVSLKIQGAYDNAVTALDRARALSPQSPAVDLRLAEAQATTGDTKSARTSVDAALQKKADYTDAILFLAQIELNDGNLSQAINAVKAAVYFEPNNATLLYQLGVLLISNKSYTDAATALEAAIKADPQFANAKFFLTEAYVYLKRTDDAVKLADALLTENPDNTTIQGVASALHQGKNPFATSTPATPDRKGTLQ